VLKWITQNYQLSNYPANTVLNKDYIYWHKIDSMYTSRIDDIFLVYSRASVTNHLDIIRYIHQKFNYTPIDKEFILYLACIGGHLNVLKWLAHEIKYYFFYVDGQDGNEIALCAIEYGHYDILKWLCSHSTISEYDYDGLIEESISEGKKQILKWLVANTEEETINHIPKMECCFENKWYDILEFVIYHYIDREIDICFDHCKCAPKEILDWVLENDYADRFYFCGKARIIVPTGIRFNVCDH
jgi:hypothetical protein